MSGHFPRNAHTWCRARAYHGLGQLPLALADLECALHLQEEVQDPKDTSLVMTLLASIAAESGALDTALQLLGSAEGLAVASGNQLWRHTVAAIEAACESIEPHAKADLKASGRGKTIRECLAIALAECRELTRSHSKA